MSIPSSFWIDRGCSGLHHAAHLRRTTQCPTTSSSAIPGATSPTGRVSELVEDRGRLPRVQRRGAERLLDKQAIEGMDDWRHKILEGLRESRLFLLVLSPEYLKSEYCEWEIVEYLKYEAAARDGRGSGADLFRRGPGPGRTGFEERAASWVAGAAGASILTSAPGSMRDEGSRTRRRPRSAGRPQSVAARAAVAAAADGRGPGKFAGA